MASNISTFRKRDPSPTPVSPPREALARRIVNLQETTDRQVGFASALAVADQTVLTARNVLEAAKARKEKAEVGAASFLTAAAGGKASDRTTIREARDGLLGALAELQAAFGQRDALQIQANADASFPGLRESLLRDQALAVVRAEALAAGMVVAAEVAELQRALARKGSELLWLAAEANIFARHSLGEIADPVIAAVLARLQAPPVTWGALNREQEVGRARWIAALEGLMSDASTVLPLW